MDFNFINQNIYLFILIIIVLLVSFLFYKSNNKTANKPIKLPFNLDELLVSLGSINNIISISATQSKVTFKLHDNDLIVHDDLNKYNISGIVETSTGITLIFGNISKDIETLVKEKL